MQLPWRSETKLCNALQQRSVDCFQRVLAIGGIFFSLSQHFAKLLQDKGKFSENRRF